MVKIREFCKLKIIVEDNGMLLEEKFNEINIITENIKFPYYYGYYSNKNFYRDKFKYLLSTKISDKVRTYLYLFNTKLIY